LGAHIASPDPLGGFKGHSPTNKKGREGNEWRKGWSRKEKGRGEREGRKRGGWEGGRQDGHPEFLRRRYAPAT